MTDVRAWLNPEAFYTYESGQEMYHGRADELIDRIADALQAAVQDVERARDGALSAVAVLERESADLRARLADAERERDGAVNLYNLMLDAKTEVRREYEAAMRLVDCRAVPPCGQCRACEKARAQALAAELAVERDRFNAVKAALNLFTAGIDEALALPPPQAAPLAGKGSTP